MITMIIMLIMMMTAMIKADLDKIAFMIIPINIDNDHNMLTMLITMINVMMRTMKRTLDKIV